MFWFSLLQVYEVLRTLLWWSLYCLCTRSSFCLWLVILFEYYLLACVCWSECPKSITSLYMELWIDALMLSIKYWRCVLYFVRLVFVSCKSVYPSSATKNFPNIIQETGYSMRANYTSTNLHRKPLEINGEDVKSICLRKKSKNFRGIHGWCPCICKTNLLFKRVQMLGNLPPNNRSGSVFENVVS